MQDFLRYAIEKKADIVRTIGAFVACESPSGVPPAIRAFAEVLCAEAQDLGRANLIDSELYGPHVRLEFDLGADKSAGQILVLGHSDTVWPEGTLNAMPFREDGGRLWGPGVLDMKSGLAFMIYAARLLRNLHIPVRRRIVLLVVSDEEIGSPSSRAATEAEAKQSDAVLVLEPGTGIEGKLKTSRKGVGHYTITIHGKAAHAGVDFTNGASAILEAARQVTKIAKFTNVARGITINPGVVSGGTRSNVVAAEARVEVDVRIPRARDAGPLDRKLHRLEAFDDRCTVHVEGGLNRPPMERTEGIASLFAKAREIAAEMNVHVEESSTGGGSDGNFTAALGIPTLDGLGGVGEGAHALNESILIERIPDRVALLAGLLSRL
jgi:glutamate carboxypeptidase